MHGSGPDCPTCSNLCSAGYPHIDSLNDESEDGVKGDLPGGINGDLAEWSDSDENEEIAEAAGQLASWSFMMAAAKPIPKRYPRPVGPPKKGCTSDYDTGKWLQNDASDSGGPD